MPGARAARRYAWRFAFRIGSPMTVLRPQLRGLVFKLALFYVLLSLPTLVVVESAILIYEFGQFMSGIASGSFDRVAIRRSNRGGRRGDDSDGCGGSDSDSSDSSDSSCSSDSGCGGGGCGGGGD